MTPNVRRWILAFGGLATAAIVAMGVSLMLPGEGVPSKTTAGQSTPAPAASSVEDVADRFLTALAAGDAQTAGALTDDPTAANQTVATTRRELAPTSVKASRAGPVTPAAGATTVEAPFRLSWSFTAGRNWSYESTFRLTKADEQWRVHWTPALVHPKLTADRRIVQGGQAGQPAVLDRDGAPLLMWQADSAKPIDAAVAPLLTPAMARVAAEQGGSGGWHIALVDAAGTVVERLTEPEGRGQGKPITATLSVLTQRAAQAAVDSVPQGAMLVAIQPSTGDLLAVAQNGAAGADPKALNGLYPPGSTFKIATATAVLQAGLADSNAVLPCPGEVRIGARTISNDDHFQAGEVPLHTAFARSCNTTLAQLAADLPPDGLSRAAGQLGINADFVLPGLTTEAGKVEPAGSTTQRVEDSIGQGAVQASPFGVALMTATVARGKAVTPRLWRDVATTVNTGYQAPPRDILDQVRSMMREVVTGGTGKTLAGLGPVFGKTGTAQFGPDGTHSHGWFTGYRGDLAFAVLVLSGESSSPALAVSNKFLAATR